MALIKCKECGHEISKSAKSCPNCGAKIVRTSGFTKLVAFFIALSVIGYIASNSNDKEMKAVQAQKEASEKARYMAELKAKKPEFVAEIGMLRESGELNKAANLAARYNGIGDPEMDALYKNVKTEQLLKELKAIPAKEHQKNLDGYKELLVLNPGNQKYKDKVIHYSAAIKRAESIQSQFSSWDGSHHSVERAIKAMMNDPASYEHVETRYRDDGDTLYIVSTIRGKNSFGGTVTSRFAAKVSASTGAVLSLVEAD